MRLSYRIELSDKVSQSLRRAENDPIANPKPAAISNAQQRRIFRVKPSRRVSTRIKFDATKYVSKAKKIAIIASLMVFRQVRQGRKFWLSFIRYSRIFIGAKILHFTIPVKYGIVSDLLYL